MKRNDDSSPVNDRRNGPMTNAERQKRYRDRKRGGPPKGRWAGYETLADIARLTGGSRTVVFMANWLVNHAMDAADKVRIGELKITPTYRRLRRAYDAGIVKAIRERPSSNHRLVCRWVDGAFEFEWIPEGDDGRNQ